MHAMTPPCFPPFTRGDVRGVSRALKNILFLLLKNDFTPARHGFNILMKRFPLRDLECYGVEILSQGHLTIGMYCSYCSVNMPRRGVRQGHWP